MRANDDARWMEEALRLAKQGQYSARPNPIVGCVLVKNGEKIAQGLHWQAGSEHAEINALAMAKEKARGATAYVTLEPCAHVGKTPPCTDALINAGVARVVVASRDPNPLVAGKGIAALTSASIHITEGVLAQEAKRCNLGFFSRMLRRRPYVRAKIAMSLDGKVAMASGESQWITCDEARAQGQHLRACSGAIITGRGTVQTDNCQLTVRDEQFFSTLPKGIGFPDPLRVVVDPALNCPSEAAIFQGPQKTVVAVTQNVDRAHIDGWLSRVNAAVDCISFEKHQGKVNLAQLLDWLGEQSINDVLVEAGPTLVGAFIQQGLLDELQIFMAPKLLGNDAMAFAILPGMTHLNEHISGRFSQVERIGKDISFNVDLSGFGGSSWH